MPSVGIELTLCEPAPGILSEQERADVAKNR